MLKIANFFSVFFVKLTPFFPVFSGPCQNLEDGAYDEDENFPDFVREFCDEFVQAPIHLQTMVSLSAPNIDCPFTGEFTFSYKMGKIKFQKVLTSFFNIFLRVFHFRSHLS